MIVLLGVKVVLEWREREHEDMDQEALQSAPTVHALWMSGLLKFFCTSPMRANVCLLEFMINYWDHDLGMFDLQGETLEITFEDDMLPLIENKRKILPYLPCEILMSPGKSTRFNLLEHYLLYNIWVHHMIWV